MTIIDLSDGRNKTTDDKKLENEDFGIISRDNPRFFRFGAPAQRESWAENSLIGKFYTGLYDQIKQDVTPVATKVNNLDKIIQEIETQIPLIGPSGTMRGTNARFQVEHPDTGAMVDVIPHELYAEALSSGLVQPGLTSYIAETDPAHVTPIIMRSRIVGIVDEAIKLEVPVEPVTQKEANRLLREGGAVGLLESVAQETSAEITSTLQKNEDVIQKWEGLNQSEDPELARSVLYELNPKEFQRVAVNTERVTWSSPGGADHVGDTQMSDHAFRTYKPHPTGLGDYWESVLGVEPITESNVRSVLSGYNVYDRKAQEERQRQIDARDAAEAARIKAEQETFTTSALRTGTSGLPEPEVVAEEVASPQTRNQNLGSVFAAIGQAEDAQIAKEEQAKAAEIDPIFGPSGLGQMPSESTAGLDVADTRTPQSGTPQTGIPSGPSAADIIAQSKANEDEVYALLQEQFGGASYFFRNNALDMKIGVTADGTIVSYDDESAENTIPLMDYIVDNGITSLSRVKGLLQKTEWWQTTDVARRTYDVMWGEMSDPERVEFLDPTTDALTKEAQFLGFDLDGDVAFTLAQELAQNGDSEDVEAIREMIIGQFRMQDVVSELSGFETQKDNLRQLARNYYAPLPEQGEGSIEQWAEFIYTGESTADAYEQNLKQIATSRFPTLDKVIREMGLTPQQYFAPYKQQIENMLGRNVDLYNEFSDVIEYIPDGGTNARAMTLSEVQNFVRALPEWQQTDDAKDRARALAFSIGQTFGEVA